MTGSVLLGDRLSQVVHLVDLCLLFISIIILLLEVFVGALFITLFFACGVLIYGGYQVVWGGANINDWKNYLLNKSLIGSYIIAWGVWLSFCVVTYKYDQSGLFQPKMEIKLNGRLC